MEYLIRYGLNFCSFKLFSCEILIGYMMIDCGVYMSRKILLNDVLLYTLKCNYRLEGGR